ncbi:MAG: type VI secretion system tip protein VgrG [Candidatus Accumulibacter sp.]|jgi:type VI secretion system VgrG family protein|nr:type VI secretion system tip protein VgrG [Accumulibacter sp.]
MSAANAHTELFRFSSQALPDEILHVIRFSGQEGLNELFNFTVQLVSPNLALDTSKLLSDRATFRILREDGSEAVFSGYPARVEQGGAFNGYSCYTVELRPALWKMTQIAQSRIFLGQTLQQTIQELLRSQEFFTFDHRFELTRGDYSARDFAMQYEESLYHYLLWRLEEQGAYYYFSQSEQKDTLHFADSPISHQALADTPKLRYYPVSGLEGAHIREVLTAFTLSQTQLPKQVVIRSYSWQNPNKPIVGMAKVSNNGLGDVYLTGEDVESDADAERLAKIRAEELRCRARHFSGTGSVPGIRPGYTFGLEEHYNPAFNRDYLVTQVLHEGSQESFLNLGLGIPLEGVADHLFYRNQFTCIEADVPYRPQRLAPRSKISGVIHAFVDGASDGSRPEIDAMGRYKLMFPFDISGRKAGDATCWVRRAQEQVGQNSGMSFPLLPGVEVLVSFVDGNPDRPYITGALANAETGALTGSGNRNISGVSTAGGNQLVFNDSPKHQGVALTTASGNGIVMGAGSLDALMTKNNYINGMATIGSTNIANVFHSTLTSRTILQEVMAPVKWKYIMAGSEAFGKVMECVQDSYKEDNVGGIVGIAAAKTILSLANTLADTLVYKKDRASVYGYTVRASADGTMSKLQTPVVVGEIIASVVSSLGKWAAQTSSDLHDVDAEDEKEKKEKGEEYSDDNKKRAGESVMAKNAGDSIAEIVATIVLACIGYGLKKEKMGGILLHSEDANIGLHAKEAIHLDTKGGMLLNAGSSLDGALEESYDDLGRGEPILKWGSKDFKLLGATATDIGTLFNFYRTPAMAYVFHKDVDKTDFQKPGYLADISDFRYTHTMNLVENVTNVRKSLAPKNIIVSKDGTNESAVVVQKGGQSINDSTPQAPTADGGIYLTTTGNHKIIKLENPKFVLTMNDAAVEIAKKEEKKAGKPSVKITENDITLTQSDDVKVTMTANDIVLKGKDSTVTLKNGEIDMQNDAKKLKLGDFTFSQTKTATGSGQLDIQGGAIKIIG